MKKAEDCSIRTISIHHSSRGKHYSLNRSHDLTIVNPTGGPQSKTVSINCLRHVFQTFSTQQNLFQVSHGVTSERNIDNL